eukprot:scaffold70426_cov108-Phaeocystis_antarctica.AAC.4
MGRPRWPPPSAPAPIVPSRWRGEVVGRGGSRCGCRRRGGGRGAARRTPCALSRPAAAPYARPAAACPRPPDSSPQPGDGSPVPSLRSCDAAGVLQGARTPSQGRPLLSHFSLTRMRSPRRSGSSWQRRRRGRS